MTPGKKAWLQRKAERARARAEEKKAETELGICKMTHITDVKAMKAADLLAAFIDAVETAALYKRLHDKHGNVTTADMDALRKEIVRRGRKRLRADGVEPPKHPMHMRYWMNLIGYQNQNDVAYIGVSDNTDLK